MLRSSKAKGKQEQLSDNSEMEESQADALSEQTPLLSSQANQAPYKLHTNESGDIVICIRDAQGKHQQGVIQLISTPREALSGLKRLPLNGYLEKVMTQYGAYPLKVTLRLIKNLLYHKEKGIAHTVKSALHLPMVLGSTVLGSLLPIYLLPKLGSNLQETILSMIPFISERVAYGLGVFTSTLVCAGWGAKLSDKILSFTFGHILDTPDTELHFTKSEKKACLNDEDFELTNDVMSKLHYAIEFLQGEYAKNVNKYQDFESSGDAMKIKRAAAKLRMGDFKTLLKYATIIRDKEMVSLSFDTRNQSIGKDAAREMEMFIAEKVLADFAYKHR